MPGTLSIIATPIGNLKDITLRALETLKAADVILCEDTRVTGKLLAHFEIKKPLRRYDSHTLGRALHEVRALLREGKNIALVTDAGTPGISDPGEELVKFANLQIPNLRIIPIPGPSAAIAALSISGFSTHTFTFLGFPPSQKGRAKFFDDLARRSETLAFYESPHRIVNTLSELAARIPDHQMVLCRELTKMHEEILRGTVAEVASLAAAVKPRGEYTLVIGLG